MSLFPAYSEETSSEKKLSENIPNDVDQEIASALPRFSSFVLPSSVTQTGSNELDTVQLSSSSSESEVHVLSEKLKKNNKESRKKRKKKKQKRERETEKIRNVPSNETEEKRVWGFLNPKELVEPSTSKDLPFMFDRKRDLENLQFGSFYKRQIANYRLSVGKCLGGTHEVFRLIFGDPPARARYFAKKYRKYKPGEKLAQIGGLTRSSSEMPAHLLVEEYIELSSRIDVGEEKLVYDPSIQMYRSVESMQGSEQIEDQYLAEGKIDLLESASFEEAQLLKRAKAFNKALDENPHDEHLWISFLKFQDKAYGKDSVAKLSNNTSGSAKERKMTDLGLLERKIAILEKALKKNPSSIQLKLERMKVGRDGLWDRERIRDEWRKLEFTNVNHLGMWQGYIAFCLEHFSAFTVSKISAVFDRCIEKLWSILSGKLLTHQPLPETAKFIVDCILWKCHFLKSAGFTERAMATVQALIEFNFFRPSEISSLSKEEARNFFEPFWDSCKPRFGDPGAIGWAESMRIKDKTPEESYGEAATEGSDLGEKEDFICSPSERKSDGESWLKIERLRTEYDWNPWRSSNEPEDPDRMVLFDDIAGCLVEISDNNSDVKFHLLLGALEFFGATLLRFDSSELNGGMTLLGEISETFENLPNLYQSTPVDATERLERIFESVENLVSDRNDRREFVTCSRLHNAAVKLHSANLPEKEKLKRLKKKAREVFQTNSNRNCLPLYWTFVKELEHLGALTEAENVAKTALSLSTMEKLDFSCEIRNSGSLAVLNLVLSWVRLKLTAKNIDGNPLQVCAKVLGNFIVLGTFSADKPVFAESASSSLLIKAKKRLTEEILPKVFSEKIAKEDHLLDFGWLGGPVVLLTKLCAFFSYCCGNCLEEVMAFFDETANVLRRLKLGLEAPQSSNYKLFDRQMEILLERKMRLLDLHIDRSRFYSVKWVSGILETALIDFPSNLDFLTRFVHLNLKGHLLVKLRRFIDTQTKTLEENANAEDVMRISVYVWLAAVYAEFTRFFNLVNSEATESTELPEIHRLRNVLERATESCPNCPIFWRFYMKLEQLKGKPERAKQVFYRAVRQCPWSKELYLDLTEICPDEVQMVTDLMTEKEIRMRLPLEELELLKEAANRNTIMETGDVEIVEIPDD